MLETILNAGVADAQEILTLQKRAYRSDAAKYAEYQTRRLTQTLADLQAEFRDHLFLKAVVSGTIVGSVRARCNEQVCHIGALVVEPAYQGRGIGKRLMQAIEKQFPDVASFDLCADSRNQWIVALYERLGYVEIRRQKLSSNREFVYLSKSRTTARVG